MLITLDKVSNARKEGKWGKLDIEYTKDGGRPMKKTLVAIGDTAKVMGAFREEGAVGSQFEIDVKAVEKDGETFYNWNGATKVAAGAAPAARTSYQAKSTFETPEERARRNVSICRQNALTNAVVFLTSKNAKATVDEVIATAREFAAFTTGALDDMPQGPEPALDRASPKSDDFQDDIPF